jgi:urease subunit gamma
LFLHNNKVLNHYNEYLPIAVFKKGEKMKLVAREVEKMMIFTAARMAERRMKDELKLNYPEAVAIIADFVQEGARRGVMVAKIAKDKK